jgi:hypothetical protein
MKSTHNNSNEGLPIPGEQSPEATLSVMNLHEVSVALAFPDDIVMALVHGGIICADLESSSPMFSSDDVLKLAAKFDCYRQVRDEFKRTQKPPKPKVIEKSIIDQLCEMHFNDTVEDHPAYISNTPPTC